MSESNNFIINDIYEILLRKQEIVKLIKHKYLTGDTYEVRLPKYTLRELIDNFESIISQCLRIIKQPDKQTPIGNKRDPTPDKTPKPTIEHTIEEKNIIEDDFDVSGYAKDLNLQFDYSTYTTLKTSDLTGFTDIMGKTSTKPQIKKGPVDSNCVDYEDFQLRNRSGSKNKQKYVFNEIDSNKASQQSFNKAKSIKESNEAEGISTTKGLRHKIMSSVAKCNTAERLDTANFSTNRKAEPKEDIDSEVVYTNIIKRINMINAKSYFAKKYGIGSFETFKSRLFNNEISLEELEDEIKKLFEKFRNRRNQSVPTKRKSASNERYTSPLKFEKLLRMNNNKK
jgi:hypothetical protein